MEAKAVTVKQLGALVAIMVGLLAIHSALVVPGILYRASEMIDKKIEKHSDGAHIDAVSHKELEYVLQRISSLEAEMTRELQEVRKAIEDK
jgi:hypothetical protein